jgi:hypothetical protein
MEANNNNEEICGILNLEVFTFLSITVVYGLAITIFSMGRYLQAAEASGSGLIILCLLPLLILWKMTDLEDTQSKTAGMSVSSFVITALGGLLAMATAKFAISIIPLVLSFVLLLFVAGSKIVRLK